MASNDEHQPPDDAAKGEDLAEDEGSNWRTTLVLLALIAAGVAWPVTLIMRPAKDAAAKAEAAEQANAATQQQQQQAQLTQAPAWVDKQKGIVSIPISLAMKVVLADLKEDPQSATQEPVKLDAGLDAAAEGAAAAPAVDQDAGDAGDAAVDTDAAKP